jgi:hypothetical protein
VSKDTGTAVPGQIARRFSKSRGSSLRPSGTSVGWGGANQGLKPLAVSLRPSGPETPATLQVQGPPTGRPRRGESDDRPPDATFQPSDRGGAVQATVQDRGDRRAGGFGTAASTGGGASGPEGRRNRARGFSPWLAPPPPHRSPGGTQGESPGILATSGRAAVEGPTRWLRATKIDYRAPH